VYNCETLTVDQVYGDTALDKARLCVSYAEAGLVS